MTTCLTDEERHWLSASKRRYGLSDDTTADRISHPNPISRCHIFRLASEGGEFALKVYPAGWWPDRLHRAHATVEFLNRHGFPSPVALRTIDGDRILNLGENSAICTTWIPGRPLWDPLAVSELGSASMSEIVAQVRK